MTLELKNKIEEIDEALRALNEEMHEIDDQIRKLKKEKSQNSGMK